MSKKTIHVSNIIIGILAVGCCLYLAWIGFQLGFVITGLIEPIISILAIWLISFYLQIKFHSRY